MFLSDESVLGGVVHCGVAEVVDSLATSLTTQYDVYVVCQDGNSVYLKTMTTVTQHAENIQTGKALGVTYYMIKPDRWAELAPGLVDELSPDIFHNFSCPDMIEKLSVRPSKALLTFDSVNAVKGFESYFSLYDFVNTISISYAQTVNQELMANSKSRMIFNIHGIETGILTSIISPEKGLFLPTSFSADAMAGRTICQNKLRDIYGIDGRTCIYAMMCRLIWEKGFDDIFEVLPRIKETGGILVVVGKGDRKYEEKLASLTRDDGVIWVNKWASPIQAAPFMAGIDFYLSPSVSEVCGLMPMKAAQYGAIPIVTKINGLGENFNTDNAIIVGDNGLEAAIDEAAALYANKYELRKKRKVCMTNNFGWDTRKQGYIEVYER